MMKEQKQKCMVVTSQPSTDPPIGKIRRLLGHVRVETTGKIRFERPQ
jgi:hypothetical protein